MTVNYLLSGAFSLHVYSLFHESPLFFSPFAFLWWCSEDSFDLCIAVIRIVAINFSHGGKTPTER